MAGGGGTRLWPKSRELHPKQMHALGSERPLVQNTTDLLHRIVGEDNVYIVTNKHHAALIRNIMPSMAGHIIIDPYRRDTAAAIGLSAVYLSKKSPDAVMGVFPSDHFIGNPDTFGAIVRLAEDQATEGHVVTIGIKPTGPETGYGYIEYGTSEASRDGMNVFRVRRFVEKPNRETAEQYLADGNYLWNSGMFIWSVPTVLRLFEKHLPEMYAGLMKIGDAIGTPDEETTVERIYEGLQSVSVDYGIMEKAEDVLVIPGDFGWNDIGSWKTVHDISPQNADGNVITGHVLEHDTTNCLIMGEKGKVIAAIGLDNLVIIDTPDALLICPKDRTQDVKKIVDRLKHEGRKEFL
jgi:mannose-1-phosphate guanylyltransferase